MAQKAGTYTPQETGVNAVFLEVRVNGIVRQADKVDWGGDTSGGLPSQVVSFGTGMLSRTGTIEWSRGPVVVNAPHPIRQDSGWPPREGDLLEIDATVNDITYRRFTGRLGKTTGSLVNSDLTSAFTDTINDSLSELVNIEPRLTEELGLSHRVAWEAIEQSKLGMLPQPDEGPGETIIHSVLQGDIYHTIGSRSYMSPSGGMVDDPYGFTRWDLVATEPVTTATPSGRATLVIARGATNATSSVAVRMTNGDEYRLIRNVANELTLQANGVTVRTETWTGEGVPILAFYVSFGSMGVATSPTTFQHVLLPDVNTSRVADIYGYAYAAAQVRYISSTTTNAPQVLKLTPVYPFSMTRSFQTKQALKATRGFENVTARSVVDSWGDATLSSVWMDEFGHALSVARDRLLARFRSRVVYVDQHVFSGSWSIGEDSVYSSVIVKGQRGVVQRSRNDEFRVTVFKETSPRGFDGPETVEKFIEADPNVDWGPIDLSVSYGGQTLGDSYIANTWAGTIVTKASEGVDYEQWSHLAGVNYNLEVERLGQRTLKTVESVSNIPAGETVYTKMASEGTTIHRAARGLATPWYKAIWATTWADYTAKAAGGKAFAPTLEHDASWWLTPGDGQKLATALMAEVGFPVPTFSEVSVLWDPTRQVGDVEDWVAYDHNGNESWRASVLVIGYDESWDAGIPSQRVTVRAISMTDQRAGKTYFDMTNAYTDYASTMAGNPTYQELYDALPGAF